MNYYLRCFLIITIIGLYNIRPINAQTCGFDELHQNLLKNSKYKKELANHEKKILKYYGSPQLRTVTYPVTIPVVVHVIHKGETVGAGSNISDTQIQNAVTYLNSLYQNNPLGDTGFRFVLAKRDPSDNATTGIVRIDASAITDGGESYSSDGLRFPSTGNMNGIPESTIKGLSIWPRDKYYNIWVVNKIVSKNGGTGTAGYAYLAAINPALAASSTLDGTAIIASAMNGSSETLAHEVGHSLGLYHPFEGGCSASKASPACQSDGDRVCDTQPTPQKSNCPTLGAEACNPTADGMIATYTANEIYNIMAYTNCSDQLFTPGQITRMRGGFEAISYRKALASSDGDIPPGLPTVNLSVSNTSSSEASPTAITLTATAASAVSGAQTVNVGVTGTGITTGDYTLSNTQITIPNGQTKGTVTFTVVDDSDIEIEEIATITISNPSSGIILGTTLSKDISITDNDAPCTIVTNTNDSGSGSLRAAIACANNGDAITFDTNLGIATILLNSQIDINKNISIDGDNRITIDGQGSTRLFELFFEKEIAIENITIQNGKSTSGSSNAADDRGGAIKANSQGKFSFSNVKFINNEAGGYGGGAVGATGTNTQMTFNNCEFKSNKSFTDSEKGAGAIALYAGGTSTFLKIYDCTFEDNEGINGGAIGTSAALTVERSIFSNNNTLTAKNNGYLATNSSPRGSGGAIYTDRVENQPGTGHTIIDSDFIDNQGSSTGGAVFLFINSNQKGIVKGCYFENNSVVHSAFATSEPNHPKGFGGALFFGMNGVNTSPSEFIVENSTFYKNTALNEGGAVWISRENTTTRVGKAFIRNSTFVENKAEGGGNTNEWGGAVTSYFDTDIENCTFSANHAGNAGGAFYSYTNASSFTRTINIKNSIFDENTSGDGSQSNDTFLGSRNIQYPNTGTPVGGVFTNDDPLLSTLANNGGRVKTVALQTGSPAIDAGTSCITTDQIGQTRSGAACDIGALEFIATCSPVSNTNDSGPGSLRDAVACASKGAIITFDASLANQTITLTSGHIEITRDLTIDGANAPNLTISGNNSSRIIFQGWEYDASVSSNVPSTVTYKNLKFIDGVAQNTTDTQDSYQLEGSGGAIFVLGVGNTIIAENCTFENNISHGWGGSAVYLANAGTGTFTNCIFKGNRANTDNDALDQDKGEKSGTLVSSGNGTLTVRNSEFRNNLAVNGAGILGTDCNLLVENTVFENNDTYTISSAFDVSGEQIPDNRVFGFGAAISTDGANRNKASKYQTIRNCTFINNISLGNGGAVFLFGYNGDVLTVEDCTFSGNEVKREGFSVYKSSMGGGMRIGGGGMGSRSGTLPPLEVYVRKSTFDNNRSHNQGGGLWLQVTNGGKAELENCTIDNNRSYLDDGSGNNVATSSNPRGNGGGINIALGGGSTALLNNMTVTNNIASWQGGGINLGSSSAPFVTVKNTIAAYNTAENGGETWNIKHNINREAGLGSNNIQSNELGTTPANLDLLTSSGTTIADPLLDLLADNGGTTKTRALQIGSPAIDAGTGCTTTDQIGQIRNGNCDIGALESNSALVPPTYVSNTGVPKFTCSSNETTIAALSGIQKLTIGSSNYYIGTRQVSNNNQNPIIAKFTSGTLDWCREDYETTGADGRGNGLFWSGTELYAVFSTDGTQGSSSQDFRRFTTNGWLKHYTDASPEGGGGPKVSIIVKINPNNGEGIAGNGTFITSRLQSSKKTNSLAVKDISLNVDGSLVILADSWSHPRNIDKSIMTYQSGSSPFDYTLIMTPNLQTAVCATAIGYMNNTGEDCTPSATDKPVNLTASKLSSTEIKLTWLEQIANEADFKIEFSKFSDFNSFSTQTVTANTTTATITGLDIGTQYYFRVKATFPTDPDSDYSNTANAKTNTLPTLTDVAVTTNEGQDLIFSSSNFLSAFTDTDSESLTKIRIISLPSNATLLLNNTAVSVNDEVSLNQLVQLVLRPDAYWNGTTSFNYTASDGYDYATTGKAVNITVNDVNSPPTFAIDKTSVTVDEDFGSTEIVDVTADTPAFGEGGQIPEYNLVPSSVSFANVSINTTTGDVSITSKPNGFGTQQFKIIADDKQSDNNLFEKTFTLTVNSVNDVPTFTLSPSNITVDENFITTEVIDINLDPIVFGEGSENIVFSVDNIADEIANISINQSTDKISITAKTNYSGTKTFTVTANDGQSINNLYTQTFDLTINDINHVPTFTVSETEFIVDNGLSPSSKTIAVTPTNNWGNAPINLQITLGGSTITLTNTPQAVGNIMASIDPDTRIITIIPNGTNSGTDTYTVTAKDGTESYSQTMDIAVNLPNYPPEFQVTSTISLLEDFGTHTEEIIAEIVPTPTELAQNIIYTISPSVPWVSINANSGTLRLTSVENLYGSGTFTITADDGVDTYSSDVDITVQSVNDAPEFSINPVQLEVNENFSQLEQVVTFPAAPPLNEANQQVTWRIEGEAKYINLSIDNSTGRVTATSKYGAFGVDRVIIVADDGQSENNIGSQLLTIYVNQQNNNPTSLTLDNETVGENLPIGSVVGRLVGTDVDTNDTLSYAFAEGLSDTYNHLFRIDGDLLLTDTLFDYEEQDEFIIRLKVSDNEGGTREEIFRIRIENVNDTPSSVAISKDNLQENSELGIQVGTIIVRDDDFVDSHTVSILNADSTSFIIENNKLYATSALNYEDSTNYTLIIEVVDSQGATLTDTLTIEVTDINDYPSDIVANKELSISENAPINTEIGSFSLIDEDQPEGGRETYRVNDNPYFSIVDNKLFLKNTINFEQTPTAIIKITATDHLGAPITKEFTVTVQDGNDIPTDISLSKSTIAENLGNSITIGVLTTEDEDNNNIHTYSLLDELNANAFIVEGNELKGARSFDFENQQEYRIIIRTDDGNGGTYDKSFTIIVEDRNDAPTDIFLSETAFKENTPIGTAVAQLSGLDADVDKFLAFEVLQKEDVILPFKAERGVLIITQALNFEQKTEYEVTIRATDREGASVEKDFIVQITDENELHTVEEIGNKLVNEGDVLQLSINITDEDKDQVFLVSAEELNLEPILPQESITTNFENGIWQLIINTENVVSGTTTIRLTVKDEIHSQEILFKLSVNGRPKFTINNESSACIGNIEHTIQLGDFISDDADGLIYTVKEANIVSTNEAFTEYTLDQETKSISFENTNQVESIEFKIEVMDSLGATATGSIIYILREIPEIAFESVTAQNACATNEFTFTIPDSIDMSQFTSWEWSFDTTTFTGQNLKIVQNTFEEAGLYTVTLRAASIYGCESSATLDVLVGSKPEIIQNGNVLIVTTKEGDQVQWYRDGQPVEEATEASHKINALGVFYVEITNAEGCTTRSESIDLFITSTEEEDDFIDTTELMETLELYPNPTEDFVNIHLVNRFKGEVLYIILDTSGKQIKTVKAEKTITDFNQEISINKLPRGVYFMQIIYDNTTETKRFVVR